MECYARLRLCVLCGIAALVEPIQNWVKMGGYG
jgi:hypothetical protein